MAVFKCKRCGGDLNITEGMTVCECEYCGTNQTVPAIDDEKKLNLFTRANFLRFSNDFDKAAGIYESIISEFPQEAEAYWGLCLCKYGIEYVDDPADGKKVPTCHRTSYDSIFDDSNFEQAQDYADATARRIYREEAKEIDRLQKAILDIAKNEEPYDIFICYKETAEDGQRTKDSVLAQDMYEALTEKGYKVFFARITLEDKLGQEYEPYIFSALSSAKIMLAVGTDYEYFNAVWVKNEWSRFLEMMKTDKSKTLIPCYADIDAYDMPKEFKNLQGQDMGKIGFMQDLLRGVGKLISPAEQTVQTVQSSSPSVESFLERAYIFLEDGNWSDADKYAEKVLDIEPKNPKAYLCKLLCGMRLRNVSQLGECDRTFSSDPNFDKIMSFGDEVLKKQLSDYNEQARVREEIAIKEREKEKERQKEIEAENKRNEEEKNRNDKYNKALELMEKFKKEKNINACNSAISSFRSLGDYKDSKTLFQKCSEELEEYERIRAMFKWSGDGITGFNGNNDQSLTIVIPDWATAISTSAFKDCESLTSIIIPDSVTSIGSSAFQKCSSLTSITIPDSVTSIGNSAFRECSSLTSIAIPDSVTSIGDNAFQECSSLTSITIPDSVTSIGAWAFSNCCSLTYIKVSDKNPNYCDIDGVLFSKDKTILLAYPCGKNEIKEYTIPDSVTSIEQGAFNGCSLTSIIIPDSITSIGDYAFSGCESLTNITIPDSVTLIGNFAFSYCSSLKSITIPDSVTLIGAFAFSYCISLTSITIPDSVTSISKYAFTHCSNLKNIAASDKVLRMMGYEGEKYLKKLEQQRIEEENKRREKQRADWRAQGLCQYCGGTLKGLFSKNCSVCGKPKDY